MFNHDHAAREARTLRDRLAAADDAMDARDAGGDPACSAAMVAVTTTVATYPTTASAFYAVIPCDVSGAEVEGGTASYVQQAGTTAFAFNTGTQVPPSGTTVLCHAVGGRWVFRYSG